jgi:hypothetical protein
MSRRQFAEVPIREEGVVVPRYRLACGSCGCGETLGRQNFGASIAVDQVPKKFEAKGWEVGKRPEDDRCPACVNREQEARRRKTATILKLETPNMSVPAPASARAATPSTDAPREMTRDHRRLIFLKLEEVYVDEKVGYSAGWGDAKVATDLGVPRAWVSTIRDENFGPGTSEEVERALSETRALAKDYEAFKEAAAKLIAQSGDLSKRLDTLQKLAARIEQAVR